ncbi:G-X-X-X-Q-X-W domain-containing protein [Crucibulum laeve]|uniref:G-X-X-X-Q-X-W domain-containing protein n=1 Tax=Crucibulum laeve TaxID=68775 RepID=A0A5C3M8D1_9AGAR|nr:G-X-X-X-Q-X-W domain-containing protein [Crucibulum laeve]
MLALLLSLCVAATVYAQTLTQYIVHNDCPTSISLYIGGNLDSTIASGGNTTKFLGPTAGFFYTTANGGNVNGAATRAGFFLENNYYYIVKDVDHFNTGISISPRAPSRQGYCQTAICESADCTTDFSQPPTRFPPPGSTAPAAPLYSCPIANTTYDITFCPSGNFPGQNRGTQIFPNFSVTKCLDVRGAVFANGTPVQIYDCNNTPAQRWFVNRGSTKVQLANTNFCLDAGSSPADGAGMKIWQCYDGLAAQQWFYTDDNRIALQNQGQCLDLPSGDQTNGRQVQTWQCTDFNTNQIWTL